jgi:hypothetical protein
LEAVELTELPRRLVFVLFGLDAPRLAPRGFGDLMGIVYFLTCYPWCYPGPELVPEGDKFCL